MGENICKQYISVRGLISKINKEFLQLNSEKKRLPDLKGTRDLKRHFSRKTDKWLTCI